MGKKTKMPLLVKISFWKLENNQKGSTKEPLKLNQLKYLIQQICHPVSKLSSNKLKDAQKYSIKEFPSTISTPN